MNMKKLLERRAELVAKMEGMVQTCETETRAFSEEENTEFKAMSDEIRSIDATLEASSALEGAKAVPAVQKPETREYKDMTVEERAAADEQNFADWVAGRVTELRTNEQNVDMTNAGSVIPTSIANRIIKAVKDRCPILAGATVYHVKGTLKVPKWGAKTVEATAHDITANYQTELSEITADSGAFTSIDLTGYLIGALTLIGKSVANNAQVDVVAFIVNEIADKMAEFIEKEMLTGSGATNNHATGALSCTNTVTAAATDKITADELIDLQSSVKQTYQANACWTVHPSTFTALKKLKDGSGQYLLQNDFSGAFPYRLLGKPVYLSDNMPTVAASAKAVLYGDYSGIGVNFRENIGVEILREKYATQHAIGVVAWAEFDSDVVDENKLAVLVMAAS